MATRIAINGATGRVGRCLIKSVSQTEGLVLSAATCQSAASKGSDAGELAGIERLGVAVTNDINTAVANAEVMIDFTTPMATLALLKPCIQHHCRLVIGTTGFTEAQKTAIADAANHIAIVLAPNMSVGVNLLFKLLEMAAQVLGDEADIDIIEAHHRYKVDAPSGTALHMGEVVANASGRDLAKCAVYDKQGHTGARDVNTISFATIRAGDIVGEHTALFATEGERIEITHKAANRMIFAFGAMRAARWVLAKPQGLFDMQSVLALTK